MAKLLRHLVSQNKVRLQQDGYDLDLTYLTDEIIAMGLPSTGRESLYRNPIDEVVRFLEDRHKDRYKVFNLCNERSYDISKFGAACATFPFDDHGAPPIPLVRAFCASAKSWLLNGLDHVVVVHCKAGKGRTGVMACCLLLHLGHHKHAPDAIAYYDRKRTRDGRGLTVPSQRRYVHYYERVLAGELPEVPQPRTLEAVQVSGVPAGILGLRLTLQEHGGREPRDAHRLLIDLEAVIGSSSRLGCAITLLDDVKLSLADANGVLLAHAFFHPHLEAQAASFEMHENKLKSQMDIVTKGVLQTGFTLTLFFTEPTAAGSA